MSVEEYQSPISSSVPSSVGPTMRSSDAAPSGSASQASDGTGPSGSASTQAIIGRLFRQIVMAHPHSTAATELGNHILAS